MSRTTPRRPNHDLPTTHWSLVNCARGDAGDGHHHALAELLENYLEPLRGHLMVRWGVSPADADDLVQAFVADRVLADDLIAAADRARGRFRTFLLTALDNFVRNHFRAARARKRTPPGGLVADDALDAAVDPASVPPDVAFDVAWTRQVIAQAVEEMRAYCEAGNRSAIWGVFEGRVLRPTLDGAAEAVAYDELVARYGFASPAQASNALVTGNRMFLRFLRAVVGRYERDGGTIDEELADLRRILARAGAGSA
jgi:RNA polymerase sigma-70 factor (ECF subfamily)